MPIDSAAYRRQSELVGRSVFGRSISYQPKGFAPVTIRAQFRPDYAELDAITGVAVESRKTVLFVHVVDLAPHLPGHGDRVVIDACDRYDVVNVEDRDGNAGDAKCVLEKVDD